ncbi:hypothetical protein ACFYWN_36870 [Streptomyces sp. NPDC002917]|uniref:hypothetical protein n=1 Tax=unclassified Streptomyces TaxID=2593676 RepID=UPI002E80D793|nr:hypothetical protein [Streptomyces sp. NBC_00562]WTC76925.1 hypothetical protein OH719_02445 [Streptomyces sp. NBC_01653]WTD93935.1 hypothetical protein OG891_44415 [Streptomyces sp. NBC_01637]WUC24966.1 hypothetical protein OHA33_43095 [Streptomyces sp. NBC_00562]
MPVRAWAELATLAKSAVAYNSGTLNRAREAGVQWMQVFDGAGCGWTGHQDPDKAAGTLRTVEDAALAVPERAVDHVLVPRAHVAELDADGVDVGMSLLMRPNAAVATMPASAWERPVNSSQGRLTRTIPSSSRHLRRPSRIGHEEDVEPSAAGG